ncbi:ion channel [Salsuginibacillus kocurii]|uniref:ion channel n=1 Tax=Salsuginibacillus kocurii TaxID=427078 RepID=UPI00037B355D|nr:ion channel [Salsuginibacillus kocurii]
MIPAILVGITLLFIIANIIYFFTNKSYKESQFSFALFFKLFIIITMLTIAFTFLYYFISYYETVLRINDPLGEEADETFLNFLYFSGVTMLSIGYGDLVPVGSARFFSIIQSGLGLLLPVAYFMKAARSSNNSDNSSSS